MAGTSKSKTTGDMEIKPHHSINITTAPVPAPPSSVSPPGQHQQRPSPTSASPVYLSG